MASAVPVNMIPASMLPDPNYKEPLHADPELPVGMDSMIKMRARIRELETALMPFALHSITMSNARMLLTADGKSDNPAGGVFITYPKNIKCIPSELLFYQTLDALGRQFVEDHMIAEFKRINALSAAQDAKETAVEGGERIH